MVCNWGVKEDRGQCSTRAVATGGRFVGSQVKRGAGAVHRYTLSGGAGESGCWPTARLRGLAARHSSSSSATARSTEAILLPVRESG